MTTYKATIPRPFAEVWPTLDDVARAQGWGVHLNSTQHDREYSKNAGWTSWGVTLSVRLEDAGDATLLTFTFRTTSITDRRRTRRDVERLVAQYGGTLNK